MQVQERKQKRRQGHQGQEEAHANAKVVEAGKRMKGDLDNLVDVIDGVLETNAEEFVRNYQQRGGE
ncbi:MAG TPA: ubiquitin-like protein Pup [Nitrospiraceae bacterium]|nr:ubiquitin-like protein Pup [Nitrospiraceae bacterium]